MCQLYGTFYIVPEYTRSFRDERIAHCLFGQSLNCDCDCPTISISGSQAANRGAKDWLADYFGLPTNYKSIITFEPRVDQFLVDFGLYLGLDEWVEGLYFWVHAPVVHTRWRLNPCEQVDTSIDRNGYAEGYFSPNTVDEQNLVTKALDFFQSKAAPTLGDSIAFTPLCYSRWAGPECDRRLTDTRVADLRAILGWNFFQDCDYHFGLNVQAAAPTGTTPEGEYLFEPIVGNGHHWEFGGGLSSHVTLWCSDDEDRSALFYLIANITHLFGAKQHRTFDLKDRGANSRYMLAERMTQEVVKNLRGGGGVAATSQFNNAYSPVANLTHLQVKASSAVQVDLTAMFNYTSCGFGWDLGYNFWYRSCEKLSIDCDCSNQLDGKTWALKGDAHVFGFDDVDQIGPVPVNFVPLSATQSNATLTSGTNFVDGQVNPQRNPNIDNPQPATGDSSNGNGNNTLFATRAFTNQTSTSIQSVLLTLQDIDCDSSRTRGLSHKLFTNLSYTWVDCEDWAPYFGVGAKVEFSQNKSCRTNVCPDDSVCDSKICDDSCPPCNLSEWGIWIKGGLTFN